MAWKKSIWWTKNPLYQPEKTLVMKNPFFLLMKKSICVKRKNPLLPRWKKNIFLKPFILIALEKMCIFWTKNSFFTSSILFIRVKIPFFFIALEKRHLLFSHVNYVRLVGSAWKLRLKKCFNNYGNFNL